MAKVAKSPFRYPGGKSRLATRIVDLLITRPLLPRYVEPFVGGGAVALVVAQRHPSVTLHLNDADARVAALWTVLSQSSDVLYEKLIRRIESTVPTVDVWRAEREAGFDGTVDDLAFRALFLNRCTFSGGMSLTANGPIGGYDQTGKWLIDARWKLHLLLPNLEVVRALLSARTVHVTSTDWTHVVGLRGYHYYDPPYITHNAKTLYSAYFTADEHIALRQHLRGLRYPWVLSYDDVTQVAWMYGFANRQVIKHRSTVQRGKPTERSEVLFWHTPRRRVIVRS